MAKTKNAPQDRRTDPVAQLKPGNPDTNTTPRGNGDLEKADVEKGREKLGRLLTH